MPTENQPDLDAHGWCWGSNNPGQLGTGGSAAAWSAVPVPVAGGQALSLLSSGMVHGCGINSATNLYCWGFNAAGQLGIGTTATKNLPQLVGADWWRAVVAGDSHTCGLTVAGLRCCWGLNIAGQLGTGDFTDRKVPANVPGEGVWAALAVGTYHSCGIRSGAELYCWGDNRFGQLGTGTTALSSVPQPVL
ncbi:hypothetical protein AB0H83_14280 [Dactylosporangium sp. NPDC050688]|uniref:RCC1 domain-containing protein n=1 Tax=Dactylosporangium sp. NPDC050688 TaxID=3157217 RepID=UPI0033E6C33D